MYACVHMLIHDINLYSMTFKCTHAHTPSMYKCTQWDRDLTHINVTHLALCVCCQQYVPCSKVSVDETFLREVLHSISNLLTKPQQLILQLPDIGLRPIRMQ